MPEYIVKAKEQLDTEFVIFETDVQSIAFKKFRYYWYAGYINVILEYKG